MTQKKMWKGMQGTDGSNEIVACGNLKERFRYYRS